MALSKEFDPKNGFLGGINIKPMNVKPTIENTPKEKANKNENKNETVEKVTKATKTSTELEKKTSTAKSEPTKQVKQNKVGRPKKYEVEKIRTTLFIPEDLLADMDIAKIKYNGSRTDYIIDLIRKDLNKNKAEYDTLKKIFNKK